MTAVRTVPPRANTAAPADPLRRLIAGAAAVTEDAAVRLWLETLAAAGSVADFSPLPPASGRSPAVRRQFTKG